MQFMLVIMGLLIVVLLIWSLIRYDPKLDLIATRNTYTLLLWFNEHGAIGFKRSYIKIF